MNSGGPTESIIHETTGILCPPDPALFSAQMGKLLKDKEWARRLGEEGRKVTEERFSLTTFSNQLHEIVESL